LLSVLIYEFWLPLTGFLLGSILGSFVNTIADRVPGDLSLVRPGSHCPECERTLSWWELVPVLSYIILRGRCRTCGVPIVPRVPLVELFLGLLGAVIAIRLGPTPEAAILLALVCTLTSLGIIDLETGLLPDRITYPLLAAGLIWSWTMGPGLFRSALGVLICGGLVWLVALAYLRLRGSPGLGGGDPKLAAALGAWLGPQSGMTALALGAGMGALYGLGLILLKRAGFKTALPLGPFLAGSGIIWAVLKWPLI